jgi:hypothetical protein
MPPNGRRVGGARVTSRMTSRRLTVQEAAEVLGTSVDAVRMRVRRGSLDSEKKPDARVYVWVEGDSSETRSRPNGEAEALLEAKDETIALLRDQLAPRAEEIQRRDVIISQLTQVTSNLTDRLRELEAPAQPPEAPQRGEEDARPFRRHRRSERLRARPLV